MGIRELKQHTHCRGRLFWRKIMRHSVYKLELGYNVMKGTEYIVSLKTSVVITEQHIVMVNSEELIGTTEYLTL
jgi:hypothetical protein